MFFFFRCSMVHPCSTLLFGIALWRNIDNRTCGTVEKCWRSLVGLHCTRSLDASLVIATAKVGIRRFAADLLQPTPIIVGSYQQLQYSFLGYVDIYIYTHKYSTLCIYIYLHVCIHVEEHLKSLGNREYILKINGYERTDLNSGFDHGSGYPGPCSC